MNLSYRLIDLTACVCIHMNASITESALSTLPVATRNCSNVRRNLFYCSVRFQPLVSGSGANNLSIVSHYLAEFIAAHVHVLTRQNTNNATILMPRSQIGVVLFTSCVLVNSRQNTMLEREQTTIRSWPPQSWAIDQSMAPTNTVDNII